MQQTQNTEAKVEVSIIIDKTHYKSPSPTTGAALYLLGHVAQGYDLYEEVHGKSDDVFIANDSTEVVLREGEHFYTVQSNLNPGTHRA